MPRKKPQNELVDRLHKSALLAARDVVREAVLDKLRAQNVCTDDLPIDELVDCIIDGQDGVVASIERDGPSIAIDFTEHDVEKLSSRTEDIMNSVCNPEFLKKCLDSSVASCLQQWGKTWSDQKTYEESELYGFRRRIEQTWGEPLDSFRMMLAVSREAFMSEAASLRRSRAKRKELREALLGIHARSLRTATAIAVLLESGLADDAYTRWRTLYELSVVSAFISDHGQDAAERYLAHEFVALKKRLDNMLSWGEKVAKKRQREIERNYHWALTNYGKSFKNDYGWAASFIGNDNPKFVNVEESVKGRRIVPPYKESSQQVHGGRAGLLGLSSSDNLTAIGYSDLGLDIPLMHSALCLMQVTITHLHHSPSGDLVYISAFMALNENIDRQCRRVARKVQRSRG